MSVNWATAHENVSSEIFDQNLVNNVVFKKSNRNLPCIDEPTIAIATVVEKWLY